MPTTINSNGQSITQYNVLTGSTNNLLNNVPPGIAGFALTSAGAAAQPSFLALPYLVFSSINMQVFSSAGSFTYTPTSDMKYCIVEVVGGGGGGGNAGGSPQTGAGGGSGGYARQFFSVATIGASKSITIGTGGSAASAGNSSVFGALITCTGGGAGTSNGASGGVPYAGGAGGSATGGSLNIRGQYGHICTASLAVCRMTGAGGNSFFAPGGAAGYVGSSNGSVGRYGSGGGGAYSSGTGGAGGDGIIVITEFI